MHKLTDIAQRPVSLANGNAAEFNSRCRRQLGLLAQLLDLEVGTYAIRSCSGGLGLPGSVTLHTDRFLLGVHKELASDSWKIVIKPCNGRSDFVGGTPSVARLAWLETTEMFNLVAMCLVFMDRPAALRFAS